MRQLISVIFTVLLVGWIVEARIGPCCEWVRNSFPKKVFRTACEAENQMKKNQCKSADTEEAGGSLNGDPSVEWRIRQVD